MHSGSRRCTCMFICCAAIVLVVYRTFILIPQRIDLYRFLKKDFDGPYFKQSQESLNITPIFLVETSRRNYLNLRQACAVEAAALHHPNQQVTLYSLIPLSENQSLHQAILAKPNIKFEVLDLTKLFSKTPMEEWHRKGVINGSSFPTEHLSDGIRLAQLWRYGGIYLDTDVITIHPLIGLRNALALENPEVANSAVLVFDQWHSFLYQCMVDYVGNYTKDAWSMQGPQLMTRVLNKICGMKNITNALNHPELCQGVTILPTRAFYPITYNQLQTFYLNVLIDKSNIIGVYTVHLWNNLTKRVFAMPGTGTFLETLAKENCPSTYQFMLQSKMI